MPDHLSASLNTERCPGAMSGLIVVELPLPEPRQLVCRFLPGLAGAALGIVNEKFANPCQLVGVYDEVMPPAHNAFTNITTGVMAR